MFHNIDSLRTFCHNARASNIYLKMSSLNLGQDAIIISKDFCGPSRRLSDKCLKVVFSAFISSSLCNYFLFQLMLKFVMYSIHIETETFVNNITKYFEFLLINTKL